MKRKLVALAVSFLAGAVTMAIISHWMKGPDPEPVVIIKTITEKSDKPDSTITIQEPEDRPEPIVIHVENVKLTPDSSSIELEPEVKVSSGKLPSGLEYSFTHSGIGTKIYNMDFKVPVVERRVEIRKPYEGWTMGISANGFCTGFNVRELSASIAMEFEYTRGRFHVAPFAGAFYGYAPEQGRFALKPVLGGRIKIDILHLN